MFELLDNNKVDNRRGSNIGYNLKHDPTKFTENRTIIKQVLE